MSRTNQEISERLFDATIRIESILHIGGIDSPEEHSFDSVEKFIEDFDDNTIKTLKQDMPWLKEPSDDEDLEEAGQEFFYTARDRGLWGFIVKVAHPVMDFHNPGTEKESAGFTWGHYGTAWFYGESLEEVLPKAEAWAAVMDDRYRAQAKGKSKSKSNVKA